MDPTSLTLALRALTPLNVVVSLEPLDVAKLLRATLKSLSEKTKVVSASRGLIPLTWYLEGSGRVTGRDSVFDVLAQVIADDPQDGQLFYLFPDLWADFGDPHVFAALQRLRDQREVPGGPFGIKVAILVVPSLATLPETFRPMFEVHYDTGLTEAQVRDMFADTHCLIGASNFNLTFPEAVLDEMIKAAAGLTTSEINRMLADTIMAIREKAKAEGLLDYKKKLPEMNADDFHAWRQRHGRGPRPRPGPAN